MRRALRRSGSRAFAAIGALLMVGSAVLCGCGLDWNLGLWTPPEEEEETPPPADTRIGLATALSGAWGVALKDGFVYVTDPSTHTLYKLDPAMAGQTGEEVWSVGGFGSGDLQFDDPRGVAVDSAGKIYVADSGNGRVKKLTSTGVFEMNIGVGDLNGPVGVALDSLNNLYVADTTLHQIFLFNAAGTLVDVWDGTETAAGAFNQPSGIAWGRSSSLQEQLYVVDRGNDRVKLFLLDGSFVRAFGASGSGDGQFNDPWGITVDSLGRIYVGDIGLDRVQRFDGDGTFLSKLTTPSDGYGPLRDPAGLDATSSYLYAAENQAKWVRAIPLGDF